MSISDVLKLEAICITALLGYILDFLILNLKRRKVFFSVMHFYASCYLKIVKRMFKQIRLALRNKGAQLGNNEFFLVFR